MGKEPITHCRKCGRRMTPIRLDVYTVKLICSCGYSDFQTSVERTRELNPRFLGEFSSPIRLDETKGIVLEMQRANRERLEIITLDELSMLVSSDYELERVLSIITARTAQRLGVDVCSVYLVKEEELVLTATHGLDPLAIGRVKLKIGEGITGAAAQARTYISVKNASQDPRYRYFPETKEERYHSMLSFPICDKDAVLGVINVQTVQAKEFAQDEIYFVSIVANLIMGAMRVRKVGPGKP